MNKIYNQGLGHTSTTDAVCCGVSMANLYEQKTGKVIPLESIYKWYDKIGLAYDEAKIGKSARWGTNNPRMKKVLEALAFEPLEGMKVKSFEQIWDVRNNPTPPLMVLWSKCKIGQFVFVIRTGCKLDETATLIPPTEIKKNTHAVALASLSEPSKRFIFENSKGINWGEKGYGRIKLLDLPQIVTEIWKVNLE